MSTVRRTLNSWQRRFISRPEELSMRSSAATLAPVALSDYGERETESVAKHALISEGAGYRVELIQVALNTPPEIRTASIADVLCLDIHEFGVEQATTWVSSAQACALACLGVPLCVAVLGDVNELSADELWNISHHLEPAGAVFHAWPSEANSFEEAFETLAKEIGLTYRRPFVPAEYIGSGAGSGQVG